MKVALAQINTVVGDVWGNVEKASDVLRRAVDGGADLVAFPELATTGYPPEDLVRKPAFAAAARNLVEALAAETGDGGAASPVWARGRSPAPETSRRSRAARATV